MNELDQIRRERDFYRRLLDLGAQTELEPFLKEALSLVVALTGARQGYLELREESSDDAWWMAHALSEAEVVDARSKISRGIVAEALASGATVVTEAALLDDRFRERRSVGMHRIGAVLCAPIGGNARLGVLYLHGHQQPGSFSEEDRAHAEVFARHLAPLADRLLARRRIACREDATRELREKYRLDGIVGRSPALAEAIQQAMLAAPLDVNVLLTGESGTGKSQLARAIHLNSPRASRPFIEINCAALPHNLIESELFGARAGSHSEARRDLPGKVAAAKGGTLFLDEVAEIPFESQSKLLQLLQSRHYYPLGATEPVEADIRLIAATNTDLDAAVRDRRLREDLRFRLEVLPVRMPSLRERKSDFPSLAGALLERVCSRNRLPRLDLSPGAVRAIAEADWPGNVRQLENALEAAAIRAAGLRGTRVEAGHVFRERATQDDDRPELLSFQDQTRRFQRDLLRRTLDETDWNVTEAAHRLDLARSHVYNLIRAFDLIRRPHSPTQQKGT